MKAYIIRLFLVIFVFIILIVSVNMTAKKLMEKDLSERNVVIYRINSDLEEELNNELYSAVLSSDSRTMENFKTEDAVYKIFTSRKNEWSSLYGKKACPEEVNVTLFSFSDIIKEGNEVGTDSQKNEFGGTGVSVLSLTIMGEMGGIAEYRFSDPLYDKMIMLLNISLTLSAILIAIYGFWILKKVIIPFNRLSDYPERLSKGEIIERLPQTKDKFFGKYIWGMNMLADKLESERRTIRRISDEHQKMVTVLVHGIKTPASNIKLFSEAISTGLYNPDGKVDEKDAELAGKIEKNADEIERIVNEAVDTANTMIFEYDPNVEPFYQKQIEDFIRDEYTNRLKVERIPFSVESEGNPLIKSDLNGICRIIRQLMDNAIKYGDGSGITLKMNKTEEGHMITIANKGETLPKSELPFVFNSLWRGSNATEVKGSGIGLYEARFIARKLGGDIRMQTSENETSVTIFIP